jgi:hypothetical protein
MCQKCNYWKTYNPGYIPKYRRIVLASNYCFPKYLFFDATSNEIIFLTAEQSFKSLVLITHLKMIVNVSVANDVLACVLYWLSFTSSKYQTIAFLEDLLGT